MDRARGFLALNLMKSNTLLWKIGLPGLCAISFVFAYTVGQSQKNGTASLPAGALQRASSMRESAPTRIAVSQTQTTASSKEPFPIRLPFDLTPGTRLDYILT